MSKSFDYRQVGRRVLETELTALRGLQEYIDEQFNQACELMLHCTGKVVVSIFVNALQFGKTGTVGKAVQGAARYGLLQRQRLRIREVQQIDHDVGIEYRAHRVSRPAALRRRGRRSPATRLTPAIRCRRG